MGLNLIINIRDDMWYEIKYDKPIINKRVKRMSLD